MSKAQDQKKETKKEATKTLKEKRAEKKVKQEDKKRLGQTLDDAIIEQGARLPVFFMTAQSRLAK